MSEPDEVPPLTQDEAQRLGEARLLEVLAGGGTIKRRLECSACGQLNVAELDAMDTDQMVRVLKFFDDQKKGDAKTDLARRAQLLQKEIAEMSSEEIAELILVLGE